MERRNLAFGDAPLSVERRDGQPAKIVGYAAVYNRFSEDLGGFREVIAPGAFRDVIKSADVRALINHDANLIIGRNTAGTLSLSEDETGLRMEVTPPATSWAADYLVSIERGDITGQSFAFIVGEGNDRWERDQSGIVTRTIVGFRDLIDVGPVVYPAYADTSVAVHSLRCFQARAEQEAEPFEPPPKPTSHHALICRLKLAELS